MQKKSYNLMGMVFHHASEAMCSLIRFCIIKSVFEHSDRRYHTTFNAYQVDRRKLSYLKTKSEASMQDKWFNRTCLLRLLISSPESSQNGSRSCTRPSYSSIILTAFWCANWNHSSKPFGGSRLYLRLYSVTAALSVLLCELSFLLNSTSASSMSFGMGCCATVRCLSEVIGLESHPGSLEACFKTW